MRLLDKVFGGISLERPLTFSGRSLIAKALFYGVPLMGACLALVYFLTNRAINEIVEQSLAKSALLQAQIMGSALEDVLRETRNQLLLLASDGIDRERITRVLAEQNSRNGEIFREASFVSIAPEDRFLLVHHKGQIISVPANTAHAAPTSPFQSPGRQLGQGHVSLSKPLEVNYAMLPVDEKPENITFYALRFSTPVYNEKGVFLGAFSLGLDLGALRNRLSLFQGAERGNQSFFFDNDGWLVFQSDAPDAPLDSDQARAGFKGDFGRPGFSRAFRPAPEHLSYWTMVAAVQNQESGLINVPINSLAGATGFYDGGASYAPVLWRSHDDAPSRVVGGVALLNGELGEASDRQRLLAINRDALLAAFALACFGFWLLARSISRPLSRLTEELERNNEANSARPLPPGPGPQELDKLRQSLNKTLVRLQNAKIAENIQAKARNQRWLRQPAPIVPSGQTEPRLVGSSPVMQALFSQMDKAARTDADILITGETGTGKELVAASIHKLSKRKNSPFISINCGALDEALLMDTLFGHVKGAFTEAKADRKGAFLAASGGTLLLDEIGNATPRVQQALLRALSTRHIRPLGSDADVPFDARIIAATNACLNEDSRAFRSDLYYRLAVITLQTPPLRDHKEDIPDLVGYFLGVSLAKGGKIRGISRGALEKLISHEWPGNVRELKNSLVRALAFCDGDLLMAEDILTDAISPLDSPPVSAPCQNAAPASQKLNERQAAIWQKLRLLASFTRQEYEQMAGGAISSRTAQYDLKIMVQAGLLRRQGKGPTQRYIVIEK